VPAGSAVLAVEPESECDAACEDFSVSAFKISLLLKRPLEQQQQGFIQMTITLRRTTLWASMATVIFAVTMPAFSQAPTDAQRSAIRSACRSDYEAHCATVPPGGAASLQCLQKNMSSLSSSCQTAVRAVEAPAAPAPAAPKAESAPAAAPAKPATDAAAPAAPKAAASPTAKKPGGGAATPATAGAPAAAATASPGAAAPAAAPVLVLRPMRPREELFVLRSACAGDVRALCGGVAPGGGRIVQCLATRAASISPACKDVLAQFAAR
jgi:hypothetical protein